MKNSLVLFVFSVLLLLSSCQTRVVSVQKPYKDNSLELYQKYTIETQDAKVISMKLLKIDETKIYGKTKKGQDIELEKSNIRQVKKLDILASVGIAVAAIAAVIFVPI